MRKYLLSTPHGALGTALPIYLTIILIQLSTPHGALGTLSSFKICVFLSIRLSTPHGALGTI